jgi:hypothetical protein
MTERDNFYLVLDLDPETQDSAAIERATAEKRGLWSRDALQGSAEARARAQLNLDRIDDIRRVMADPGARRAEGEEAKRLIADLREAALKELSALIGVLRKRGGPWNDGDLTLLKRAAGPHVSEAQIKTRLDKSGVTKAEKPAQKSEKPRLLPSILDELDEYLKALRVADLYEFLGASRLSSPMTLRDEADRRNKEILRIGRTDALSEARKKLCGACLSIFANDAQKLKYDNGLAHRKLETLRPRIEIGVRDNFLAMVVQDELVHQARTLGINAEDARDFIAETARKRKWGFRSDVVLPAEQLRQCGGCGALQDDMKAERCRACGEALAVRCPKCRASVPNDRAICSNSACRFPIGDWIVIAAKVKEARTAFSAGRLHAAERQLRALPAAWRDWELVKPLLDEVARQLAEREAGYRELRQLVASAKLTAAGDRLHELRRKWTGVDRTAGDELGELAARIADGIAKAQRKFEEGERARTTGQTAAAIAYYRGSLLLCADYQPAAAAMALLPPAAPRDLAVTADRAGFVLRWSATDHAVDGYTVVRKAGASPTRRGDGVWHQDVTDVTASDRDAEVGVPWYYAVFSWRDNVPSTGAARSGPHLRVAPVSNLAVSIGDAEVALTWSLPHGAMGAEVWRAAKAAPAQPGIGERLRAGNTSLHDTGLTNDVTLGYLIAPLFADPKQPGGVIYGPGTTCLATPMPPPPPVLDLTIGTSGSAVEFTWTPPKGASVQIRQLDQLPPHKPADGIPIEQAQSLGRLVVATTAGAASLSVSGAFTAWFVPLTLKGSTAIVGKAVPLNFVEPARNLVARCEGRNIELTWEWPSGATQAAVCYRSDDYPLSPDDPASHRHDVTMAQYRRDGAFRLRQAVQHRCYCAVFTLSADRKHHSAAVTKWVGLPKEVHYSIVRPLRRPRDAARQHAELVLEAAEVVHLPPTILIAKPGRVPLAPHDGELVATLPELEFVGRRSFPLTSAGDVERQLKLFCLGDAPPKDGDLVLLPVGSMTL